MKITLTPIEESDELFDGDEYLNERDVKGKDPNEFFNPKMKNISRYLDDFHSLFKHDLIKIIITLAILAYVIFLGSNIYKIIASPVPEYINKNQVISEFLIGQLKSGFLALITFSLTTIANYVVTRLSDNRK